MPSYDVNVNINPDDRGAEQVKASLGGVDEAAQRAKRGVEDVGQATQGMGGKSAAAGREMDRMSASMGATTQKATALNKAMRVLSGYISAFAAYSFISSAVRGFSEWELSLTNIEKTTNMTRQEVQRLGDELLKIARIAPLSANGLASIATAAGQVGIRGVQNLTQFSRVVADLTIATNLYEEEAVFALKRTLDLTARNIQEAENLASVWVRLGNNFAVTERQIASFTREIARGTTIYGFSPEDISALGTSFAESGASPQVAGSSMLRFMGSLNEAVSGNTKIMSEWIDVLGISDERFKELWESGGQGRMNLFLQAVQGLSQLGQDAPAAFDRLGLSSIRVQSSIAGLGKVMHKSLIPALKDARMEMKEGTALMEETSKFYNIYKSKMQVLGQTYGEAFDKIGAKFIPFLTNYAEQDKVWISDLIDSGKLESWAQKVADALQWLYDNLDRIISGISALFTYLAGQALWGKLTEVFNIMKVFFSHGFIGNIGQGISAIVSGFAQLSAGVFAWEGMHQFLAYQKDMERRARAASALGRLSDAHTAIDRLSNLGRPRSDAEENQFQLAHQTIRDPDILRESVLSSGLESPGNDPWRVYWDSFLRNGTKTVAKVATFFIVFMQSLFDNADFVAMVKGLYAALVEIVKGFFGLLWDGFSLFGDKAEKTRRQIFREDLAARADDAEIFRARYVRTQERIMRDYIGPRVAAGRITPTELGGYQDELAEIKRVLLGSDSERAAFRESVRREYDPTFEESLADLGITGSGFTGTTGSAALDAIKTSVEAIRDAGTKAWNTMPHVEAQIDKMMPQMASNADRTITAINQAWHRSPPEYASPSVGGSGFFGLVDGKLVPMEVPAAATPVRRNEQQVFFGEPGNQDILDRWNNTRFGWINKPEYRGYGYEGRRPVDPDARFPYMDRLLGGGQTGASGEGAGFFDGMLSGTGDWAHAWEQSANQLNATFETLFVQDIPSYMGESVLATLKGAQSMGDAFRGLANLIAETVIKTLIEVAVRSIILQGIGYAFGAGAAPVSAGIPTAPGLGGPAPTGATGGLLSGGGTGTSDSIPAYLSNGEFVTNARNTSKFLPLLEAINSYSGGGMSMGGGGSGGPGQIIIEDRRPAGSPNWSIETDSGLSPMGVLQTRLIVKEEKQQSLRTGETDTAYRHAYGARRQPIKR